MIHLMKICLHHVDPIDVFQIFWIDNVFRKVESRILGMDRMVELDDVVLRMVQMVLDDQKMDIDRMAGVRCGGDCDSVQMLKVHMVHMDVHDGDYGVVLHKVPIVHIVGMVGDGDVWAFDIVRMILDGLIVNKVQIGTMFWMVVDGFGILLMELWIQMIHMVCKLHLSGFFRMVWMVLDDKILGKVQIVHIVGMVGDGDDDVHQMDLDGRMGPKVGKVHGIVRMEVHDGDDGVVLHMVRTILDDQMVCMDQIVRMMGMVDDGGSVCILHMVRMVLDLRMIDVGQMGRMVDVGGSDDNGLFRLGSKLLVLVHSKIVHGNVDDDVFFFHQMENLIDNRNLILNDDVIFFHTFYKMIWYF